MSTVQLPIVSSTSDFWLDVIQSIVGKHVPIDVVETEHAWTFLTDQHAYKIKKPHQSGHANNRSLANRRTACLNELWLNKRLAPSVYLGVLPISQRADGEFSLNGKGEAIEYVIKMRRLPPERRLPYLIEASAIAPQQVTMLARMLANFYHNLSPETISREKLRRFLIRRIENSTFRLRPLLKSPLRNQIRKTAESQLAYIDSSPMKLNARVCDGRIVDGHGDLRPEYIYFERCPIIVGCVESDPELRKLDVLDDLSQLTVGCESLGRDDIAATIMTEYSRVTGDEGFPHLEAFYKSLRAVEMAAQELHQAGNEWQGFEQHSSHEVCSLLNLAKCYAQIIA